jgi:hypothetical protein
MWSAIGLVFAAPASGDWCILPAVKRAPNRRVSQPRSDRGARRPAAILAALSLLLGTAAGAGAQGAAEAPAPASQLTLEALEVEPAQPGPDTLCRLRVRVRNAGERDASALGFDVRIDGVDLPVYRNQLFMQQIPAGATETVALYNFWTTESSRPTLPADGKLRVEVALREAQWFSIADEEGVEVWRPLEPVAGLPVRSERSLDVAPAAAAR